MRAVKWTLVALAFASTSVLASSQQWPQWKIKPSPELDLAAKIVATGLTESEYFSETPGDIATEIKIAVERGVDLNAIVNLPDLSHLDSQKTFYISGREVNLMQAAFASHNLPAISALLESGIELKTLADKLGDYNYDAYHTKAAYYCDSYNWSTEKVQATCMDALQLLVDAGYKFSRYDLAAQASKGERINGKRIPASKNSLVWKLYYRYMIENAEAEEFYESKMLVDYMDSLLPLALQSEAEQAEIIAKEQARRDYKKQNPSIYWSEREDRKIKEAAPSLIAEFVTRPDSIGQPICKYGDLVYYRYEGTKVGDKALVREIEQGKIHAILNGYSSNKEQVKITIKGFTTESGFLLYEAQDYPMLDSISTKPGVALWDSVKYWHRC